MVEARQPVRTILRVREDEQRRCTARVQLPAQHLAAPGTLERLLRLVDGDRSCGGGNSARKAKAQHGTALGELGVRNQHAPQFPGRAGNRSFDAHKASARLSGLEITPRVELETPSK